MMFNEFCFTSKGYILLQMISFPNKGWFWQLKERIGFLYRRGVIWFALDIEWCLMNFVLPQIDLFDFKWFLSHIFNDSLKFAFMWNLHLFRICAHMKSWLQMITFSNKGYFWQLKKRIGFLYRRGVRYFHMTSNDV